MARDHTAVKHRELIGVKTHDVGLGLPHFDGTWPHSIEVLEGHFSGVSVEDQKRIARQNVIELTTCRIVPSGFRALPFFVAWPKKGRQPETRRYRAVKELWRTACAAVHP